MSLYVDANLLIRLCLDLDGGEARSMLSTVEVIPMWPAPVTDILRFEVKNGIQRMVFESLHGGPLRVSRETAAAGQALFDELLVEGNLLSRVPTTLRDVEAEFDQLVLRHTAKHGFRTYDIMHVSSALHLGCTRFLSFDKNALTLARLEGLQTN